MTKRALRAGDDLGTLLMNALAIRPSTDAERAAGEYGGAELLAAEQRRERLRQDRINELRRQFVDGPVLVFPGGGRTASDSRGATVIPGIGTVYFHTYSASGPDGRSARRPDGPFAKDDGGETSKSQRSSSDA